MELYLCPLYLSHMSIVFRTQGKCLGNGSTVAELVVTTQGAVGTQGVALKNNGVKR